MLRFLLIVFATPTIGTTKKELTHETRGIGSYQPSIPDMQNSNASSAAPRRVQLYHVLEASVHKHRKLALYANAKILFLPIAGRHLCIDFTSHDASGKEPRLRVAAKQAP